MTEVLFIPIKLDGFHCLVTFLFSVRSLSNCSYVAAILQLLPQLDERGALAAFVLRGFGLGGDVGMGLQEFADGAAEDAGAVAVDDAHAGKAGEEGAVEILLELLGGFVDGAADEVDLHAHVVGVGAGDGDVDVFLLAGGG